ncbi:MAG: GntR family transcriptional regulator [Clostridia bacterium]|nr:GntR family transcriptional regulator [Clostridia bacterium]
MIQLDYKSSVPICDQIVNGIIRLKALGILKNGSQLPSVRQLAMQLSVNPNTIQKAYGILETNGIVCSVKGKGSFVSDDTAAEQAVLDRAKANFLEAVAKARELGLTTDQLTELVQQSKEGVDAK